MTTNAPNPLFDVAGPPRHLTETPRGLAIEAPVVRHEPHVLVVDDCEPLRYLKTQYLLDAGFRVSEADTGGAALRSIETERPDLVLLDVNLPDLHGSEVCREVKTRWDLPVVYTSSVDIPAELHGTAEGCVVSLDEQELLGAIRQAMRDRPCPSPLPNSLAVADHHSTPARRSSPPEIAEQARVFESGLLREALDASTAVLIVLNENREIVFCNRAALGLVGVTNLPAALGLHLGEALGCVHAARAPQGCGNAESCTTCDLRSLIGGPGSTDSRGCNLTRSVNGLEESCDLMVSASPLADPNGLVVCTLVDLSPERRRQASERMFFHDVLNLAGAVKGLAALLREELKTGANAEIAAMLEQSAAELISAIDRKRSKAESGQGR